MKTEQILLALTISECGSITKAAQKLYMAQPNASSSIYALEKELGYSIFERTYNGVSVTAKGKKFLEYAHSIHRNLDNIYSLKNENEKIHLSVSTYAYPFAENAFVKFCKDSVDTTESLSCNLYRIGTIQAGINNLTNAFADVSIIVCSRYLHGQFDKIIKQKGLISTVLGYTSLYLTVSGKHPLASKETLDLSDYTKYPCYSNAGIISNYVPDKIENLLNAVSLHIVTEPSDLRIELLKATNGFAISTPYSVETLKTHNLVTKKIPNAERSILLLTREEDQNNIHILKYINLVREEMPLWFEKLP